MTTTTQDIIETRQQFAKVAATLSGRKACSTDRRRKFTITRDQLDAIVAMAELNGLI